VKQDDVDALLATFEDMDYSAHQELQDLGRGTMLAAGRLLWEKDVELSALNLKRAVLAFYGYLMDENTFASSEDQHFMDLCDKRKFNAFVIDEIAKGVTDWKIHEFQKRGWFVVKLRSKHAGVKDNEEGFYIFTSDAIAA